MGACHSNNNSCNSKTYKRRKSFNRRVEYQGVETEGVQIDDVK
jgi:hypothetical protein